jgi:hypothetical protein
MVFKLFKETLRPPWKKIKMKMSSFGPLFIVEPIASFYHLLFSQCYSNKLFHGHISSWIILNIQIDTKFTPKHQITIIDVIIYAKIKELPFVIYYNEAMIFIICLQIVPTLGTP